jgi:predicted O-linked N-acetylglucosamine transferase (SPINDLY family)
MSKIGRNKPCPCGSSKKNKNCCGPGAVGAMPDPVLAEQYNEQGNSLADQGRLAEAIGCYEKALEINPLFAGAWNNLGIVFKELGQLDKAISCYRRSLEQAPTFAGAWNNLGNAHKEQGSQEAAVTCYEKALSIVPDSVQVNTNLGNILYDQHRYYGAIPFFERALEGSSDFSTIYKLAYSLRATGNNTYAIALCQQALVMDPRSAAVLNNMGAAYDSQGRPEEAIACYRRALSVAPDSEGTYCNLLLALQYSYTISNEELFAEACQYASKYEAPLRLEWYSDDKARKPGSRLRIGIVSADFRNHSVGYFLEGVIRQLDRDSLTLIAYANQTVTDSLTDRIMRCFETWLDVSGLSDRQLADRIRKDEIDLLIDLSGHTQGNRLMTFARKPAPVQATWLGYPNTTGFDSMDFIIADPVTLPPDEERYYSEKVWRLPETYICFTPPNIDLALSELPMLENGHITFGCFNNPAKVNDTVISCWSEILRAVPDSVLLLKYRNFDHETEKLAIRQRFSHHGIDPVRLRFIGFISRKDHLTAYNQVDIALDPFPYTGVTTTCEALWMGVPTITLRMVRGMFGHNGELIMKSVGLDGWVTGSIEEYQERAIAFACNPEWLTALRSSLRQALLSSPLCASERFARNLEDAFRGMILQSTGAGLRGAP